MRAVAVLIFLAALVTAGCGVFDSEQVTLSYTVQPDSFVVATTQPLPSLQVDLSTLPEYAARKSEIRGLADLAILGHVRNNGLTFIKPEYWFTPGPTAYTNATQVRLNGKMLWAGPELAAAPASFDLDWNKSAGLVDRDSFQSLLEEIQGDGAFTLYVIGAITGTNYNFLMEDPALVMIVDTKK